MASPDPAYLTQDWCGHPHYLCPRCGYDTFTVSALEGHLCRPRTDQAVRAAPVVDPVPAAAPPTAAPPTRKKGAS